jgi:hypothetical protein
VIRGGGWMPVAANRSRWVSVSSVVCAIVPVGLVRFGGLRFPILCTSQPRGAAMVASGTYSVDYLFAQVSVPEALVEVGPSEMTIA